MDFCGKCGVPLDGEKICLNCGALAVELEKPQAVFIHQKNWTLEKDSFVSCRGCGCNLYHHTVYSYC